jgi:hypothetical protein
VLSIDQVSLLRLLATLPQPHACASRVPLAINPGREWTWWAHTGGGNFLACKPPMDPCDAIPVEYHRALLHSATASWACRQTPAVTLTRAVELTPPPQVISRVGAAPPFLKDDTDVEVGPPLYTNLPWVFPIAHMFGKHVYIRTGVCAAPPRFFALRTAVPAHGHPHTEQCGGEYLGSPTAPSAPLYPPTVTLVATQQLQGPPRRRLTLQVDAADHFNILFETGARV